MIYRADMFQNTARMNALQLLHPQTNERLTFVRRNFIGNRIKVGITYAGIRQLGIAGIRPDAVNQVGAGFQPVKQAGILAARINKAELRPLSQKARNMPVHRRVGRIAPAVGDFFEIGDGVKQGFSVAYVSDENLVPDDEPFRVEYDPDRDERTVGSLFLGSDVATGQGVERSASLEIAVGQIVKQAGPATSA